MLVTRLDKLFTKILKNRLLVGFFSNPYCKTNMSRFSKDMKRRLKWGLRHVRREVKSVRRIVHPVKTVEDRSIDGSSHEQEVMSSGGCFQR